MKKVRGKGVKRICGMNRSGKFIPNGKSSAPSNFTISLSRRTEQSRKKVGFYKRGGYIRPARNIRVHFKRSIEKWLVWCSRAELRFKWTDLIWL